MMRAKHDQGEVVGDAAVTMCPTFEYVLRVFFGLDFGDNSPVSVVDKQKGHFKLFPSRQHLRTNALDFGGTAPSGSSGFLGWPSITPAAARRSARIRRTAARGDAAV